MISPNYRTCLPVVVIVICASLSSAWAAEEPSPPPADGTTVKAVLDVKQAGANLVKTGNARPYEQGFRKDGTWFLCDNGTDPKGRRGVAYGVTLNQTRPEPVIASGWSKASNVTGSADSNFAVYVDLLYTDGTHLYGQTAPFNTGTHDWEKKQVVILPDKPVRQVNFYLLLREHGGQAWFRDPEFHVVKTPKGSCRFDGVAVVRRAPPLEGFQVRDVAAGSDFVCIAREALGLKLRVKQSQDPDRGVTFFDVVLSDTTGKDRAVTLLYAVPLGDKARVRWFDDPRRTTEVEANGELVSAGHFHAGANGRLSHYPLGAVESQGRGLALGIDLAQPAFFRIGCNVETAELFLAYDLGLTPEKPEAQVGFCRYDFAPVWGFRSALARYYDFFPEAFRCRTPEQGLWMPFAAISKVKGWEDFGFKFKEGNDETRWDDEHGILTFRYTEPMTWWMPMPRSMP